jgi:hypothetical protein
MDWENQEEFETIVEKQYTLDVLDVETGEEVKIKPEIEIDTDEILLSWEVQQRMATITDVGSEVISAVQELVVMFVLSANKVCFEIIDIFNTKYVVLTVDLESFEDSIKGL